MTWQASTILESLTTVLSSATEFKTIGNCEINYDEEEALVPIVQLHISKGNMHAPGTGVYSNFQHSFTIQIDMISSATAEFDLSAIENPAATPAERATAIAAGQLATKLAHDKAYAAFEVLFDYINGVENYDMGLPEFSIKARKFEDYKIDNTVLDGGLATVFLTAELSLVVVETVTGLIPEASEEPPVKGIIDGENPID